MLDLGCGKNKKNGAIGVDFSDRHDADIVHNLNVFPYPFLSNSVDFVYVDNVLEHLDSPLLVLDELYRICKPGAGIKIIVPYFRSIWAYIDPTHKTFYTVNSLSYFDPRHSLCTRYDYSSSRFFVNKITFNNGFKSGFLKSMVVKCANLSPERYERFFSHLLPLDDITFDLIKC